MLAKYKVYNNKTNRYKTKIVSIKLKGYSKQFRRFMETKESKVSKGKINNKSHKSKLLSILHQVNFKGNRLILKNLLSKTV